MEIYINKNVTGVFDLDDIEVLLKVINQDEPIKRVYVNRYCEKLTGIEKYNEESINDNYITAVMNLWLRRKLNRDLKTNINQLKTIKV